VQVVNGIAHVNGVDSFSWVVFGTPGDVPPTTGVFVSVTGGIATITGANGLNHSFVVFGSPGTAAQGLFLPVDLSNGFGAFILGGTTYTFTIFTSAVAVQVINNVASLVSDSGSFSWVVWGTPGNVPLTFNVLVSVTDGFATITGANGLNHSFVVFGSPGTAAEGLFIPTTLSNGFGLFTLEATNYTFIVFT
jgi:hypothetical protein